MPPAALCCGLTICFTPRGIRSAPILIAREAAPETHSSVRESSRALRGVLPWFWPRVCPAFQRPLRDDARRAGRSAFMAWSNGFKAMLVTVAAAPRCDHASSATTDAQRSQSP